MQDSALPTLFPAALPRAPVPLLQWSPFGLFYLRCSCSLDCWCGLSQTRGAFVMIKRPDEGTTGCEVKSQPCPLCEDRRSSKTLQLFNMCLSLTERRAFKKWWTFLPPPDLTRSRMKTARFCQRWTPSILKFRQSCWLLLPSIAISKPDCSVRLLTATWKVDPVRRYCVRQCTHSYPTVTVASYLGNAGKDLENCCTTCSESLAEFALKKVPVQMGNECLETVCLKLWTGIVRKSNHDAGKLSP